MSQQSTASIEDRVYMVICNQVCALRQDVTRETRLADDLGADSLDKVEIAMEMEDEFEICISDQDAAEQATIGNWIDYVKQQVGS